MSQRKDGGGLMLVDDEGDDVKGAGTWQLRVLWHVTASISAITCTLVQITMLARNGC